MDESVLRLFSSTLKKAGYNTTKTRVAVFRCLGAASEPLTMHELYSDLNDTFDRSTLYRIIRMFEKVGIVQRVPTGWKYKLELTDVFVSHHHHAICLKCGKIIPIEENPDLESLINKIADKHNISAINHQLEIQGVCVGCQRP